MASGKTHAAMTLLGSASLVAGAWKEPQLMISAVGCLFGVLFSPDLDQDGVTLSEGMLLRRSLIIGVPWFLYWWPYAKLIPHRHWLSHFPVVGTLGRLLYFAPVLWLFWHFGLRGHLPEPVVQMLPWLVLGLAVSDALHWLLDRPLVMPGRQTWHSHAR